MKRSIRGFTIIELLIVIAIIGILAAMAIPNLLTAVQRAKQKRTMADMRSIAIAWEARATDLSSYAGAGGTWTFPSAATPSGAAVFALLTPTYTKAISTDDGWGTPLGFGLDGAGAAAHQYGIRSTGRDGVFEGGSYNLGTVTNRFDCDIVYSNGSFIQWPEGVQER